MRIGMGRMSVGLAMLLAAQVNLAFSATTQGKSPLDELPPYIRQVTHFGERADWSHDGKRLLFLEKTFGDVYEVELATGIIRPMTHHYFHEGYTRALYLSNGDILLSGARTFDASDPWPSRSEKNAELVGAQEGPVRTACAPGREVLRGSGRLAKEPPHRLDPRRGVPHGGHRVRCRHAETGESEEDPRQEGPAVRVRHRDAELPPTAGEGADLQRLRLPGHGSTGPGYRNRQGDQLLQRPRPVRRARRHLPRRPAHARRMRQAHPQGQPV